MVSEQLVLGVLVHKTLLTFLEVSDRVVCPPWCQDTILVITLAWCVCVCVWKRGSFEDGGLLKDGEKYLDHQIHG